MNISEEMVQLPLHIWFQYLIPLLDLQDLRTISSLNHWFKDLLDHDEIWSLISEHHIPSCLKYKSSDQTYRQFYLKMCHLKPKGYTWTQYDQELAWSFDSKPEIDDDGNQEWKKDGQLHRLGDLPAIIKTNGYQMWYQYGKLHRGGEGDAQPALIGSNGHQEFYQNGKRHRDGDKPASIYNNGHFYYQNGEIHRDGDQPAVIDFRTNRQEWYQHGQRHRDGDQPAIIDPIHRSKEWWCHGRCVRCE
jgi:hypothetical protein